MENCRIEREKTKMKYGETRFLLKKTSGERQTEMNTLLVCFMNSTQRIKDDLVQANKNVVGVGHTHWFRYKI